MTIPEAEWLGFIERLRRIDDTAAEAITEYVKKNPGIYDAATGTFRLTDEVISYAYAVATKYGEASAALAAEMYDEVALAQSVSVPPAVPAKTATYGEVARALYGTFNDSKRVDMLGATTGRLVKQAGFDTTVQNAKRDGAQIAFVPHGDTCAFCLVKGSRGWDKAGSWAQNMDGHAAHCHAHCDCTYAVRFDKKSGVAGYDPDRLKKLYDDAAPGGSSKEKINVLRRQLREENKEEINAQKRETYAARKEADLLKQESFTAKPPANYEHVFDDFNAINLSEQDRRAFLALKAATEGNGFENGLFIRNGIPGDIITSGEKNRVRLPETEITAPHTDLFHSHTGTTPPSSTDLKRLVNENVDRVGVVTYNGDAYIVDATDCWRPSVEEFIEDEGEIRKSVDADMAAQAYLNGWSPDELNYMCIREELYRIGVRYGWKIGGEQL